MSTPGADAGPAGGDTADAVEEAGRFRIYLGAAAGVGKTYAMLNEGCRRKQRGTDVVIGFVECHGRKLTEQMIDDLEVVPRTVVDYRGSRLEEMDLAAVLRRRPTVALIDELAHTNVPGSGRNDKRWQDVMEIIAAGIDVITTVNIQHLESIADEVEHMTGARVRERVPDWVVRKADQIELVDSSPEQLRRRMLHGNIYPKGKVSQALTNFFRTDNLSALRELALREVAEDVEERRQPAVLDPLSRQAITERVLVLVTPEPRSQRLLRRSWRSAQRLGGELDALWVRKPGQELSDEERTSLAALRRLAVILGAHFLEEEGELVPAVRKVAAERGSTYVFVGTPDESRRREVLRGSLVSALVRELPGIDIRVVANRADRQKLAP